MVNRSHPKDRENLASILANDMYEDNNLVKEHQIISQSGAKTTQYNCEVPVCMEGSSRTSHIFPIFGVLSDDQVSRCFDLRVL